MYPRMSYIRCSGVTSHKIKLHLKNNFQPSHELTEITGSMAVKFQHFYYGSHKVSCVLYVCKFTVDDIRDQPDHLTHKTCKVVSRESLEGRHEGMSTVYL
jgi:hypothetical protein